MFSFNLLCCVFGAIIASTNAGVQKSTIETIINDCKTKTGAPDEDLQLIMAHKLPETDAGVCFASCVKKNLGLVKDDNTLDIPKIEEMLTAYKAENPETYAEVMKIVKICESTVQVEADECKTTKKMMQCFKDEFEKSELHLDLVSMIST